MKTRLVVAGILLVLLVAGGLVWFNRAVSPVSAASTESKIFVVKKGEALRTVAARLKEEGLIRDPLAFFLIIKKSGSATTIQAGDFRLSPAMNAYEILDQLQHGTLDIWVTFLEGWRKEEVGQKLEEELNVAAEEFLPLAKEGYLFPDTYLMPKDASASAVISIMQSNFDKKTAELQDEIENQGLTVTEGVILASIVEREGRTDSDRPVIAGILLKRLREGWALNVDAALQYALGYQEDEKTWWKKSLTLEDKEIASPFNTYTHAGLPPSPISNPGLGSLTAVARPVESSYWFYLHDPQGQAHFAVTLEEHNENIVRYLRN